MSSNWTLNKYRLVVNSLRVELSKIEGEYESDAFDIATDFLIANMDLKEYLNLQGYWDAVQKLADDIGYVTLGPKGIPVLIRRCIKQVRI